MRRQLAKDKGDFVSYPRRALYAPCDEKERVMSSLEQHTSAEKPVVELESSASMLDTVAVPALPARRPEVGGTGSAKAKAYVLKNVKSMRHRTEG